MYFLTCEKYKFLIMYNSHNFFFFFKNINKKTRDSRILKNHVHFFSTNLDRNDLP
jgi:hypothetical protein